MPKILADEKIYRAVIEVVIERGYAGATTKQMAEAAEVSEVTLFRKYGNKPELVKRSIYFLIAQTAFDQIQYTGDMRADLIRIATTYQRAAQEYGPFFTVIMAEMPRYPELIEQIDSPFMLMKAVGEILLRYQQEGKLREENPLHALSALMGPLIYLQMMDNAQPSKPIPSLDLEEHVAMFIKGRKPSSCDN
jgi:AcrR family transcriptional regulator